MADAFLATVQYESDGVLQKAFVPYSDESSLWKGIGRTLLDADIPSVIDIDALHGWAHLDVKKRGTWTDDKGGEHPSMYVTVSTNLENIFSKKARYGKVWLNCVHAESNNYKAYVMEQLSSGEITAKYGRIPDVVNGNYREINTPYPSYLFWIRYYEKLSKGYTDCSDAYFAPLKKRKRILM